MHIHALHSAAFVIYIVNTNVFQRCYTEFYSMTVTFLSMYELTMDQLAAGCLLLQVRWQSLVSWRSHPNGCHTPILGSQCSQHWLDDCLLGNAGLRLRTQYSQDYHQDLHHRHRQRATSSTCRCGASKSTSLLNDSSVILYSLTKSSLCRNFATCSSQITFRKNSRYLRHTCCGGVVAAL